MPKYTVTDPSTGRKVTLTGDSPPTEQELEEVFSSLPKQSAPSQSTQPAPVNNTGGLIDMDVPSPEADAAIKSGYASTPKQPEQSISDKLMGAGETGLSLLSGATTGMFGNIAGALHGAARAVQNGNFGTPEAAQAIQQEAESTGNNLTYSPRTLAGQDYLQKVGDVTAPLAGISPFTQEAAIIGKTAPMAANQIAKAPINAINNFAEKSISADAAPTIETLKNASRDIYKKIDETGAVVSKDNVASLANDIASTVKNEGYNRRMHPAVNATLQELKDYSATDQPISNLDTLRKVANNAAGSMDKSEARLGKIIVGKIDGFLDNLDETALIKGDSSEIGPMYRDARQLWQRATKAELIEKSISKAKNQASGFENGLRVQFRSILNNDKKSKGFTADEKAAMAQVVQGGSLENVAKLVGKLGFGEGQATNMLMGSIGAGAGAAVGGPAGAVAVPLIGQVSRGLAQKLTRNNAELVSQIVRSGKDAKSITRAYLAATPIGKRSATDLAELLIKTGASGDLKSLSKDPALKTILSDTDYLLGLAANQSNQENQEGNK